MSTTASQHHMGPVMHPLGADVSHVPYDTVCSPTLHQKTNHIIMQNEFSAFVAIDWGDQQHAVAVQRWIRRSNRRCYRARAEALHTGGSQGFGRTLPGHKPVALATEAGATAGGEGGGGDCTTW